MIVCGDFFLLHQVLDRTIQSAALPYAKHECRHHAEPLYASNFNLRGRLSVQFIAFFHDTGGRNQGLGLSLH